MRNKKRNTKKRYKISCKKILSLLVKIAVVFLMLYVVINRVQDINGLGWFFTTWN